MEMSLLRLVFYGIPEGIAIVALVFTIAGVKFDWKKIIFMGTLIACFAFVIRLTPITFGVHTIVSLGILIFFLNYSAKVELARSIISVLITSIVLAIVETASRMMTMNFLNWNIEDVMKDEILITITGIPEIAFMALIIFITKKYIIKVVK